MRRPTGVLLQARKSVMGFLAHGPQPHRTDCAPLVQEKEARILILCAYRCYMS